MVFRIFAPARSWHRFFYRARAVAFLPGLIGLLAFPTASLAQDARITGSVRGSGSAPVAGAAIELDPLGLTTVTDRGGRYTITVPPDRVRGQEVVLRISSIGYRTVERRLLLVEGEHREEVVLGEEVLNLDEVLVTGTAGRRERRAQPAVIGGIDAAALSEAAPVNSVFNLLQSRLPGVTVQQRSGTTGTGQVIRIRGRSSVALSNEPLVFIDGVRMDARGREFFFVGGQAGSRLNDLRLEDIERVEVAKGPAAATLYGADASAGVVQIFTKRGRAEEPFTQVVSWEHGRLDADFTPPDNWATCMREHIDEGRPLCHGVEPGAAVRDNPLARAGVLRSGRSSSLDWSIRGGGARFGSFASVGMDREEGTLPNNEMERISGRVNFDFFASDALHLDFGFGLGRSRVRLPHNDNNVLGYLGGGLLGNPLTVGFTVNDGWFAGGRQVEAISRIETVDTSLRVQPRITAAYTPAPWFTNRLTLGADLTRTEARSFFPRNDRHWYPDEERNSGRITQLRENRNQLSLDYLGTLSWSPTPWVTVDQSVGAQIQTLTTDLTSATGIGLSSNRVRAVDAAARRTGGQSFEEERQVGGLGQLQLTFWDRLFVQGAVRVDRHSAFGTEADPFVSPRVGASYVVSDEPLFRRWVPRTWISDLRLRAAYGATGRSPASSTRATYVPEPFALAPERVGAGVVPRSPGNPDLRPERGTELEVGGDVALIGRRVGLEVTYFRKRTWDLLLERALSPSLGFSESPLTNVGRVSNWGYEVAADLRLVSSPDIEWDVRAGFSTLTNRVLDMGDVPPFGNRNWVISGSPVLGYHGFRIHEVDVEGQRVTVSDQMEFLGNPPELPGREATLSSTAMVFGALSLDLHFDYRGNVHLYNSTDEWRERVQGVGERSVRRAALAPEDRLSRFGPHFTESGAFVPADLIWDPYVEPADFLRFREASISYRFPATLLREHLPVEGARITLAARNLAVWTKSDFVGFDPESSYDATTDFLTMPPERRLLVRFRVEF